MALNINAMKAALAAVSKKGNPIIWKPKDGDNVIRIVPLASSPENPFQIVYSHFNFDGKHYTSPLTFGDPDPIAEFSDALIAEGNLSKEEYKAAKKYAPQPRTYLPIVVRGEEKDGVKYWGFGKTTLDDIMKLLENDEYGDISDPDEGTDLIVTFTPATTPGTFAKTSIVAKRKTSPLTTDSELRKKLLTNQPDLLATLPKSTYEELAEVLKKHLERSTGQSLDNAPVEAVAPEQTSATPTSEPTAINPDVAAEFNELFNS